MLVWNVDLFTNSPFSLLNCFWGTIKIVGTADNYSNVFFTVIEGEPYCITPTDVVQKWISYLWGLSVQTDNEHQTQVYTSIIFVNMRAFIFLLSSSFNPNSILQFEKIYLFVLLCCAGCTFLTGGAFSRLKLLLSVFLIRNN